MDGALSQARGFFDLPSANVRISRRGRQHKYDRVGLTNESSKALPPFFGARDCVAVERCLKTQKAKGDIELISKVEIVSAVRDKRLKLAVFAALESLRRHRANRGLGMLSFHRSCRFPVDADPLFYRGKAHD
jgi:hypothetical protein